MNRKRQKKAAPKPSKWNRLDNAAKIFPPTSNKRDTKVFRFACELKSPVEPRLLQQALDETMIRFPYYSSILKKGLFWYYLEETDLKPVVKEENMPPSSPIYDKNIRRLLFEVTYFKNRINLEIYHSLSDGTGALRFLQVLVYRYLLLRFPEGMKDVPPFTYDASMTQKADDSFQKYYQKNKKHIKEKSRNAYHIRGAKVPDNRNQLIEAVVPVREVVTKAHEYGATLTTFLIAALMCSVADIMTLREKKKPVVVTVPVNLRKYFPSVSARNFFSVFEVQYDFKNQSPAFKDVVLYVTDYFKRELTAERMGIRMNKLAALEHNLAARVVPRPIKDFCLWVANWFSNKKITAAFSNIGVVDMPEEMQTYIRMFDVFVNTGRLQVCMCSYGENLTMTFTSAFESTEVQKNFFRILTGMGISATIITPPTEENRGEEKE